MLTWAVVSFWKRIVDTVKETKGTFEYGADVPVTILLAIFGDVLISLGVAVCLPVAAYLLGQGAG